MPKKFFLFDLDGTLADTGPAIMNCIRQTLTTLGYPPPEAPFLRQFVGPPLTESFRHLCGMDPAETRLAIQTYRTLYLARGILESPLYPGMDRLLRRLARVAVLGVATSKQSPQARKILSMRGVESLFPVVVGDDGVRPNKAAVIAEALRRLGDPPPEEAVMVGDRKYDVEGAKACGIETIGVRYGYSQPGELEAAGARYFAATVEELESLCLGLTEKQGEALG